MAWATRMVFQPEVWPTRATSVMPFLLKSPATMRTRSVPGYGGLAAARDESRLAHEHQLTVALLLGQIKQGAEALMGLFGSKAMPEGVDPELASVVIASTEDVRRLTLKCLSNSQGAIQSSLETGERPVCIAWHMGSLGGDMLIVVTNRRSMDVKKRSIVKQLRHEDVAETSLGTLPNGDTNVQIASESSRLDYRPNDPMRFEQIIQFSVRTPRVANRICAAIDQYLAPKG